MTSAAGTKMRLSSYHVVTPPVTTADAPRPVRLVFATRTAEALVVDDEAWRMVEAGRHDALPDEALQFLVAAKVLVADDEDELAAVLDGNDLAAANSDLLYLVVQPTRACQLGCGYCGQEHTAARLSPDHQLAVEARAETRLASGRYSRVIVGWFGAEPLIGLNVIRAMTPRLKEIAARHHCSYAASMATNGLLLTPDIARELCTDLGLDGAEVTLDGTAAFHDARRFYKSGSGSFDQIVRNVVAVARADLPWDLSIRCNVDRTNVSAVSPLIDLLASLGLQDKLRFYVAPVHSWGNDAHLTSFSPPEFASLETEWLAQLVRRGFTPWLLPTRKPVVCLATMRDGELVDAHGSVFNCTEVSYVPAYGEPNEYSLGDLDTGIDPALGQKLGGFNDRVRRHEYPCSSCRMLPVCGGACPKEWLEGHEPCPSTKHNIVDRLILELARNQPTHNVVRPTVQRLDVALANADGGKSNHSAPDVGVPVVLRKKSSATAGATVGVG